MRNLFIIILFVLSHNVLGQEVEPMEQSNFTLSFSTGTILSKTNILNNPEYRRVFTPGLEFGKTIKGGLAATLVRQDTVLGDSSDSEIILFTPSLSFQEFIGNSPLFVKLNYSIIFGGQNLETGSTKSNVNGNPFRGHKISAELGLRTTNQRLEGFLSAGRFYFRDHSFSGSAVEFGLRVNLENGYTKS